MNETMFTPGALVRARYREWVVQPGSKETMLVLRPLGGSDEDIQVLDTRFELSPVQPSIFSRPDPGYPGSYHSALLLRDALRLKLRSAAGPFRCFGHIAVEPRPYQLVPLLMALRQTTIRLLIADDVGIGKTIEAALIIREMLDRGEIERFAVLCPPHLVEQWVQELREKFHMDAQALNGATVSRLERETPPDRSLFTFYKALVISLDYIKSDRHRDAFLANAPEMVVVDEAHTCTQEGTRSIQQRYHLVRDAAKDQQRHLLLLTATPHSGKEEAFHNLLALLKPDFAALGDIGAGSLHPLREELARYLVQRRRKDIDEWQDNSKFPERRTKEVTYRLTGEWQKFFNAILEYWTTRARKLEEGGTEQKRLIVWYATLSMLRCVSSSPAAAAVTMEKSLDMEIMEGNVERILEETFDTMDQDASESMDDEPPSATGSDPQLNGLIQQAKALRDREGDPKFEKLVQVLEELIEQEHCKPVVFCRYIATAEYVADRLRKRFGHCQVDAVTGLYPPEERKTRIEALMTEKNPILVATDCLSEGINLQEGFDAVVHYDLAWNPTRHEQREGRVDRFGQKSSIVRCVMLYGEDNPVDGFVLKVILEKARKIRNELGILVPVPEESAQTRLAMMKAMLLRSPGTDSKGQGLFDFEDDNDRETSEWQNYLDRMKNIRTVFSQQRLKPQEVWPEFEKQVRGLGDARVIERFIETTMAYLQQGSLERLRNGVLLFKPMVLPPQHRERFAAIGYPKETKIAFSYPAPDEARFLHRSNPFVSLAADIVLETALEQPQNNGAGMTTALRRTAVFTSNTVEVVTRIYLLRFRHEIIYTKGSAVRRLLAEEALPVAARGASLSTLDTSSEIEMLLDTPPTGNLSPVVMTAQLEEALRWYEDHEHLITDYAKERARMLLEDHRRVRDASQAGGTYDVRPNLPVDLVGLFVILPDTL